MTKKKRDTKNKTGRSEAFGIFKDQETDWAFRRTLEFMGEKAAEIGECLYAARQIDEKDGESWINQWRSLADRVDTLGEESLKIGHIISARECFMRASNYYRTAEYGASPSHPQFETLWKKSVSCFKKGAVLFTPPIQFIDVRFEGKSYPGYFWRPVEDHRPRPTLIAAGGNDSSLEEVVWWVGNAAVRRGYNFFVFDHPGHRGALHLYNDCIKRPDYELPYKAAIDTIEKLPGVDERLVMTGYSFGGYVVCRVAAYEERLKAIAPNSPIIDLYDVSMAFAGDFSKLLNLIDRIPVSMLNFLADIQMKNKPLQLAFKQYTDWTAGLYPTDLNPSDKLRTYLSFLKKFSVMDHLDEIHCATLAMVSEGDGEVMINQARDFVDKIPAKKKALHIFTLEQDGSNDHCQLDNRSRGAQVMFDFFDGVLDYQPTPRVH